MNSIDRDATMIVTFADGRKFYQLINGEIVDALGREVTFESHADCYDDVISAFTPNARIVHFVDYADWRLAAGRDNIWRNSKSLSS
jgi:hypothetical protein